MFKVLNETPPDKLEAALAPLLDIDGALRFLALEIALVNTDGYWTRASDYSIYQDVKGQFHVIPHDMNEALINEGGAAAAAARPVARLLISAAAASGRTSAGVRVRRWPSARRHAAAGHGPARRTWIRARRRRSGARPADRPERREQAAALEAAGGAGAARAVSRLRARHRRKWLDWKKLGPMARSYQALIGDDVKPDTRKLYSSEAFETGLGPATTACRGSSSSGVNFS